VLSQDVYCNDEDLGEDKSGDLGEKVASFVGEGSHEMCAGAVRTL
jgi:hypothetical protein